MAPGERFAPEKAEADLMRRRAAAIAKRLRGEWTFQTVGERPSVQALSTREDGTVDKEAAARRAEGRALATDQYTKGYGKLSGISRQEIEEIRSRGPKRGDDGEYLPTTQAETVVPTRPRETYRAPAKLGKTFANEEHEQGEWRKDAPLPTRTRYLRGEDQEAVRLSVEEVADATDGSAKATKRLIRKDSPQGVDTTAAGGGKYKGSEPGHEIFAMDTKGDIYATDAKLKRDARGKAVLEPDASGQPVLKTTHHSSLVHGEDVIGAGEIEVEEGIVTDVTELSGHYLTSPTQMADTINEMEAQGVPMIKPDTQRRAMVRLKGHQEVTGQKTEMTFETFSQTGGNVQQIRRKEKMLDELEGVARSAPVRPADDEATDVEVDQPAASGRPAGAYSSGEDLEQEIEAALNARTSDPKELLAEAKRRRKEADEEAAQSRTIPLDDLDDDSDDDDSDDDDDDSDDDFDDDDDDDDFDDDDSNDDDSDEEDERQAVSGHDDADVAVSVTPRAAAAEEPPYDHNVTFSPAGESGGAAAEEPPYDHSVTFNPAGDANG